MKNRSQKIITEGKYMIDGVYDQVVITFDPPTLTPLCGYPDIGLTYQAPEIPRNQLMKTFPEALSTVKRLVKEDKKIIKEIKEHQQQLKTQVFEKIKNYKNLEFITDLTISAYGRADELQKAEARLKENQYLFERPGNLKLDIEAIKQVPLTNFIDINSAGFAKCPFHGEKTASLKYYKKNNSFYCFGCHVGGDVIKFIMLRDNCSFIEAIKKIR